MKEYKKEIIVILGQIFMFYIFPLFAGPTDAMGLVLLLILSTFMLSLVLAMISSKKNKYCYPIVVMILFIPTIAIYYNSSAIVHVLWYFVTSLLGFIVGEIIYRLRKWLSEYEDKRTKD